MKKNVQITQTNLLTNEHNILYKGILSLDDYEDKLHFCYKENNHNGYVEIVLDHEGVNIMRKADITTDLVLKPHVHTKGSILTGYGLMEIDLYTRKLIRTDTIIAIEYEIKSFDEVAEAFRLVIKFREGYA